MSAPVKGVPVHAIGCPKANNRCTQPGLVPLKPLYLTLLFSKFGKELPDQGGHRRIQLGRFDTRPAIGVIIHRNCDILHIFTVMRSPAKFKPGKGCLGPVLLG